MKSNTYHLRQNQAEAERQLYQCAQSFLESFNSLEQEKLEPLKELRTELEGLVDALQAKYAASKAIVIAEERFGNALPASLYNVPFDHPIFAGKKPTRVITRNRRYDHRPRLEGKADEVDEGEVDH